MQEKIPMIGLGTYQLLGKECVKVVQEALSIGYRHFDTAFAYENHKEVGEGIKGFDRSSLFITTKLAIGFTQIDDQNVATSVEKALDLALRELGIDYLDLLLIHWPDRKRPMNEILNAMEQMVEKGKLRFKGVSNFTQHHLQDVYDANLSVAFNQVEYHPYLNQKELLEFAKTHGTELIAYRPFGKGKLIYEEPLFQEIGDSLGKKRAQIILRWLFQKNIPAIVKASSFEHLTENYSVFDFELSDIDMEKIDSLNKNFRYTKADWNDFDY